jgi:hypothetical protein
VSTYFSQSGRSKEIWQKLQTEHNWLHSNRPKGRRFLGSIRLSPKDAETLLNIVRDGLSSVRTFTLAELEERFSRYDSQEHWIKLTTLALSEYAYYDKGTTAFWEGVCIRLNLQNTQGTQKTLREILDRGFGLLGLVENHRRNRYVSTLWLQSGIPHQNLKHFAQVLQEISQEYGWWEITHAEPEDLSQMMYEFCLKHHPQWGKLLTFLKSSYAEDNDHAEPISGQLLQGIAIVALELERHGQSPKILEDENQQEQILKSYCLPSNFFLRSWENLIDVLTPQNHSYNTKRRSIGLRKRPMLLMLDIADSVDIQLYLPPQMIWQQGWNSFQGTYCKIHEQGWEGTIPQSKDLDLEIPALSQTVSSICEEWKWQLKSHTKEVLAEWQCEGVAPDFPVLIFDAWTGDRLLTSNGLKGSTEIICFFANGTQMELSKGIELLDSFVPCSISGWRGQQVMLVTAQEQLTFRFRNSTQTIQWRQLQSQYPQLRGLKLKGKQPAYLEIPTVWYPPSSVETSIKVLVEDLANRKILTAPDEIIQLKPNSNWQSISLNNWVTQPGSYAVQLWINGDRWSEQFEVKSSFELNEVPTCLPVAVCDRNQQPIKTPLLVSTLVDFWLEDITLKGLWALEEIQFLISNEEISKTYQRQASNFGSLNISLAAWRDVLPESNLYALSYQRRGEVLQRLLAMAVEATVSFVWTNQELHLSGLLPGQSYFLTFWNALNPQSSAEKRSITILPAQDTVVIPLSDLFGMFHVQLGNSTQSLQDLGWWCGISQISNLSLPDEFSDDLFEYCMNLFENQPVEAFVTEVRQLKLDFDAEIVQQAITALEEQTGYLPNWLDRTLLKEKLQALLLPKTPPKIIPSAKIPQPSPPKELTYLVALERNTSTTRKAFNHRFVVELKKSRLESSIQLQKDKILPEYILVKLNSQEHLPALKDIVHGIGSGINTAIKLTEWKR